MQKEKACGPPEKEEEKTNKDSPYFSVIIFKSK
jgi:hypothetical protein